MRRCPSCGAQVPPDSLTCPECYTEVPRDMSERPEQQVEVRRSYNRTLSILLAVIPAFFGLLGLSQIYRNHRSVTGWKILVIGLVLYALIVGMMFLIVASAGLMILLAAIPILFLGLVYLLLAGACLMDAYMGDAGPFGFLF